MLVHSNYKNDHPLMENDFRFSVVSGERLEKEMLEALKPRETIKEKNLHTSKCAPQVIIAEEVKEQMKNISSHASKEVEKTVAWRYWTQQTITELSKYHRTTDDSGDLQMKTTKSIQHDNVYGVWATYYLKDVKKPFLDRVQWYRPGMTKAIGIYFPSFLRLYFIEAYGEQLGITTDILNLEHVEDDEYDEYYTPEIKVRFTPAGWNKYDAPKKYSAVETFEKVSPHVSEEKPQVSNWHSDVRSYGYDADEIKHLWGDVYELNMFYTWGSQRGGTSNIGSGESKVTSTSKVNSRTGKIISVRVTSDDGFDGDIDENNKLKVLTDQFTPDGFVYGFKVAKTMKGEPCIVKLMIPRGARVACHVNDTKIRCDKAWVVGVFKFEYDEDTQTVTYGKMISVARSFYYKEKVSDGNAPEFLYRVGDMIEVKDFEPDLGRVCVPGIHFFFSQKQLFHLIKRDVTYWRNNPEFIKGYKRVLGLKFQSRSDILQRAFNSSVSE
jgi:hypothetical protein